MQSMLSEQRPIVLMGRGHSGTRVLSWLCTTLGINLGTSHDLATGDADDQKFTQQIKKITLNNIKCTKESDVKTKDLYLFQKAVNGYYTRLNCPEQHWGWKFPETYLIGPYIAKTFPQARYIHLVRDGRDIAFKRHLTDDPKRRLGKKILTDQDGLKKPHHLQAAISWAFQVDNFDHFRQSVTTEQILDVTFENLCLNPRGTAQHLCEFLGLTFTADCEHYIQEQINPGKVGQYLENDPKLVQEVEERIKNTLMRYAYL
ncbi:MAG: sulfotransferase [SAR324 cluster bacterium]|nr:sulfotransferase [SAR324 cluster bacterium]